MTPARVSRLLGRGKRAFALPALVATAACATAAPPNDGGPGQRMDQALEAIREGEYEAASEELFDIFQECESSQLGYHALLVAVAADLDPRNSARELDRAAETATWVLSERGSPLWSLPIAETLYLVALNLGATPPGPAQDEEAIVDSSPDTVVATPGPDADPAVRMPEPNADPALGVPILNVDSAETATPAEVEADSAATVPDAAPEERPSRLTRLRSAWSPERPDPCGGAVPGRSLNGEEGLPELPGQAIAARIAQLEEELEEGLARLEEERARLSLLSEESKLEIERLEEELERIRRTLVP